MTGVRTSKYFSLFTNFRLNVAAVALLAALFAGAPCLAQQPVSNSASLPSAPSSSQAQPAPDNTRVTVPVGTRIDLVLTHPLDSNAVRAGDSLFAQTTAPVLVDDQVAIPAGAFIRGKVESLTRNGTRGELRMQSASLVMGSSVVSMGGPVNIESEYWTAANNPSGRSKAAIILVPMLAMPVGALIGHAADGSRTTNLGGMTVTTPSHTGLVVGTTVGFAAGLGTSLALMAHSHGFYLEDGSPMHMTTGNPISLTRSQIAEASHVIAPVTIVRHVPVLIPTTPTDTGTCYTPGTQGTPDTVIPGTPGVDGSPGTPSITIPGIPATPPIPHPCP